MIDNGKVAYVRVSRETHATLVKMAEAAGGCPIGEVIAGALTGAHRRLLTRISEIADTHGSTATKVLDGILAAWEALTIDDKMTRLGQTPPARENSPVSERLAGGHEPGEFLRGVRR